MVNADNVIYGEALGHTESACSLEGLEIKVSHRLSAMCMWLDSKGRGASLVGNALVTCSCWEKSALSPRLH